MKGKRTPSQLQYRKERMDLIKSARAQEEETKKHFFCSDDVKWQNEIANDLMDWADIDDSRLLDSFPLSRRLSPRRFYKMAEKNAYFAECLEYAKAKLGERMEIKIVDQPQYISKALPMYSTLWEMAEEKKKAEVDQANVPVYFAPTFKLNEKGDYEVVNPVSAVRSGNTGSQ